MTADQAAAHSLTHYTISDAYGERLTPGCVCGWYSADGSHWRFERHIEAVRRADDLQIV